MTLATHAVLGAAVASLVPSHPVLAVAGAFASHFLIDAVPHGHYHLLSLRRDDQESLNNDMIIGKAFLFDLCSTGSDATIGLALSFLLFNSIAGPFFPLVGACAGILPDALQFAYWKIRREPLTTLQRFHIWIHSKQEIKIFPMMIAIELAVVSATAFTVFFITRQ